MRFLLCGRGTYEILWSLHAALVDAGHESVLALPDVSQELIDRAIDAVLVLNLFEIPRDTVAMLLGYIATKGRRPLAVHICLKHPLEETGARTPAEIREVDGWMAREGIVMWCMCPGTIEHCRRLGFTRIVYAPLGLHRSLLAQRSQPDGSQEMYKRWMAPDDAGLVRFPFGAMREGGLEGVEEQVGGRVLYLGQGWPDDDAIDSSLERSPMFRHAAGVAERMRESPGLTRLEALDAAGLTVEAGDPDWVVDFNRAFKLAFAIRNRVRFMTRLRDALGPSLVVWGNGWERHGIAAGPVSSKPRNFYHAAACCLDFGSLAYDTAIFPRTLEVIKREGLLVTWRHADSDALLGPCREALSFTDEDDAVAKLAALAADSDRRRALKAGHLDWAFDALSFANSLNQLFAAINAITDADAR